jgi:hypothetical protein
MHIVISGTLSFTNGNKLELPCNSSVTILPGGTVQKTTPGGGTSTLVSICNTNVWTASDGAQTGPLVWGTPPTGLPVELISFWGTMTGKGIFLEWEVASEINNEYFSIERMNSLGVFVSIGRVEGRINATTLYLYTFTDEAPESGNNYYRLVQVDLDGTRSYSDIINVTYSPTGIFVSNLYPNPVDDVVNLSLEASDKADIQVEISDISGRVQLMFDFSLEKGANTLTFMPGNLSTGTYMVRVFKNGAHADPIRLFVKN